MMIPPDRTDLPFVMRLLPEAERREADCILSAIMALNGFVDNFEAALRLFQKYKREIDAATARHIATRPFAAPDNDDLRNLVAALRLPNAWVQIAARDGALQIYQLGKVIEKIKGRLHNIPTLYAMSDKKRMQSAGRMMNERFPNFKALRNIAAHSITEFTVSANERDKHAFRLNDGDELAPLMEGTGSSVLISGAVLGTRYTVIEEGKVASYEMTDASLQCLQTANEMFLSAFDGAICQYRSKYRQSH